MRRSLVLLSPLQQTLQHSAAQCLCQVAALHSSQPEQQQPGLPGIQQPQQQHRAPGRPHDYHAAALAEQPQWHNQQQQQPNPQHQLQQRIEQLQRRHEAAQSPPQQHTRGAAAAPHTAGGLQQQLHAAPGQAAADQAAAPGVGVAPPSTHGPGTSTSTSSTSSSHSTSTSSTGAAAELDATPDTPGDEQQGFERDSVFTLSSPQQQYSRTLAALHQGTRRNLDQLAYMFDPQAVLAAPDRGAAVLEAIMVAAAKLQDLQLLRQLLRCTAAAGNSLGSTGHRAVMQCLASCGRPVEALEWLQKRVPDQQLTPQLLRSLVQPLLKRRHVQAAQQALDYAESKLMQLWEQELDSLQHGTAPAETGVLAAAGDSSEADDVAPRMPLQDRLEELFALRLLVAGATGQLAAVQEQWAAIQAQAAALQQQQGAADQQWVQQELLGVKVRAHYALALGRTLGRVGRGTNVEAAQLLQSTMWQVLDTYHASAWGRYAEQHLAALQQGDAQDTAAVDRQQQWLAQQQQAAQQQWQRFAHSRGRLGWQQLDPAAVMPQEVAAAALFHDRHFSRQAWHVALAAAASVRDRKQVQWLLAVGSLLKLVPQGEDFEELLQLKMWQGAPPEALEELFGEMMSWGVIPSVAAYETVMEAYALHRDMAPAEAMLDRMQAAGHQPVLRTYNRLLHGVALNGDLAAAMRVYNRLRLQGLQPDEQTMRTLFKCVRMYASNVRVATARSISLAKAGDREAIRIRLGQRSALFASAYSQLVLWQRDMVAAGLKHTNASLVHLANALERLGAVEDCLQLARLAEEARPGDPTAHRAALRVVGRTRDVRSAGEASRLLAQLTSQGEPLTRQDYIALISSQFWLKQDHEQLLQTVAAMQAAGHQLDQTVLQQLLHVYCHCGMWGEALQVLTDVAAGRFSSSGGGGSDSTGVQGAGAGGVGGMDSDHLWHVVLRKLWEKRASDELLNEFLKHMAPAQLQRFKLLYGLQPVPGQEGRYTVRPLEDWQVVLQDQDQEQQWEQQQGQDQQRLGGEEPLEQLLLDGDDEASTQPSVVAPVYS